MRQPDVRLNLNLVLLWGTRKKVYQRRLAWKIFQVVVRRRGRSINYPRLVLSSLAFLLLPFSSRPSKFTMWTRLNLSELLCP